MHGPGGRPLRRSPLPRPGRGKRHRYDLPAGQAICSNHRSRQIRQLLRDYVPFRITSPDPAQLQANIAQSELITNQLWSITEDLVRANPNF